MRNLALLLAATIAGTACADQSPSAPGRHSSGIASADVAASQPVKSGAASKPIDQVGFTKVQVVYGPYTSIAVGQQLTTTVSCPAGTTVTGGGYETGLTAIGPVVGIWRSHADGPLSAPTGWIVSAANTASGAVAGSVQAWATCAS